MASIACLFFARRWVQCRSAVDSVGAGIAPVVFLFLFVHGDECRVALPLADSVWYTDCLFSTLRDGFRPYRVFQTYGVTLPDGFRPYRVFFDPTGWFSTLQGGLRPYGVFSALCGGVCAGLQAWPPLLSRSCLAMSAVSLRH